MAIPPFGSPPTPDASSSVKGKVQLTNDLGGTASSPTVTNLTISSEAEGDILYRNATEWVRLAKGTDGQVLTMNDAATAPNWETPAAGGETIRFRMDLNSANADPSATFPLSSHVVQGTSGTASAGIAVNSNGMGLSTGTSNVGWASIYYSMGTTASNVNKIFDHNPRAFFHISTLGDNSDHKWFIGIGAAWSTPSDSGAARKLVGFRLVRDANVSTVYAVVGSGTAETATDVTASLDGFSASDQAKSTLFWFDMTSGTNVKFYHNYTLLTTITTNLPSGALTSAALGLGAFIFNNTDGTVSNLLRLKQCYAEMTLL